MRKQLAEAGISEPESDAWLLFEKAAGFGRNEYFLRQEKILPEEAVRTANKCLEKRLEGQPVQYILGESWFYGYRFLVKPGVLIPRFDTEILVEEALKVIRPGDRVLDLCTGSGCIILSLAKEAAIEGTGTDLSEITLETAARNNEELQAGCAFIKSDLFENVNGRFDLIVSNPPYIKTGVIGHLDREVKDHEPCLALDGGADGLDLYRRIIKDAPEHLEPGGHLILEIGYDQAEAVTALLSGERFDEISVIRDLAGNDRVVKAGLSETAVFRREDPM